MSPLLTSSPKGHLLGVDPSLSLSAGRHKANPATTYRRECLGYPSLPCPVCVTGIHVSPAWSLVSAVPFLFSVGQSLCQVCNKSSSDMSDVSVRSDLVTPPPGRREVGEFKRLSHLACLFLGGWASSRGSPPPRVGPFWAVQASSSRPLLPPPSPLWVASQ